MRLCAFTVKINLPDDFTLNYDDALEIIVSD